MNELTLTYTCPHCLTQQPFAEQRCRECGLNMLSNQAFSAAQDRIVPNLARIRQLRSDMESGKSAVKIIPEIQRIWEETEPYVKQVDGFNEIWEDERKAIGPYAMAYVRFNRTIKLHTMIGVFLLIAPLMGFMLYKDWMVVGLLMLPALGWGYLGIWKLIQSAKG
ncbi:hypothetical protein [Pontibacter sp. G13]|uniref:hypothetical protein n=1 Tax=Pontibacter sp. G13 TaxID=3074898 RepID=UPI0028897858|nr:hypothetical protein [Pontibacter sp. G13]WNJ16078.1 hypothetical protein RJD25_14540 [Pontibacter sp. G13]